MTHPCKSTQGARSFWLVTLALTLVKQRLCLLQSRHVLTRCVCHSRREVLPYLNAFASVLLRRFLFTWLSIRLSQSYRLERASDSQGEGEQDSVRGDKETLDAERRQSRSICTHTNAHLVRNACYAQADTISGSTVLSEPGGSNVPKMYIRTSGAFCRDLGSRGMQTNSPLCV